MTSFRSIFFAAVLTGVAVGIVMFLLQAFTTVPLILEAEVFEAAEAAPGPGPDAGSAVPDHAAVAHEHGDVAWAPAEGFQRFAFTTLANILAAVGFALLLAAGSEFAGGIAGWRQGLLWGLAGFAAFTLAPGLGVPPELPGIPAAELLPRQIWWIGCVAATAAALALIVFGRSPSLGALAVALLVLPHLIGAPQPESHESPIPASLQHRFVVAVTVTNLLFWVFLGTVLALVRPRFAEAGAPQRRLA
jgi:cobalt transporter subunit CbtA